MAVEWNESMKVGVEIIDDQHRELIKKIGEFQKACEKGKGMEVLAELYSFALQYAEEHFKTEENFMHKFNYDKKEIHIKNHNMFREEFAILKERLQSSKRLEERLELILKTASLLTEWFIHHIMKMDKLLGEFLKSRGL